MPIFLKRAEEPSILCSLDIPEELLGSEVLTILHEGNWKESPFNNQLMFRLDPENTGTRTMRHVHVADRRNTANKTQQASWNTDRTRHDKKSFNSRVGGLSDVQNTARAALGLSDDVILEHFATANDVLALLENSEFYEDEPEDYPRFTVSKRTSD